MNGPVWTVWWRVGWVALLVLNGVLLAMHVPGIWFYSETPGDQLVFVAYGFVHLLSLAILAVPYRRHESWAWWATWGGIIPVALLAIWIEDAVARALDVAVAVLMTLAQILALPRRRDRGMTRRAGESRSTPAQLMRETRPAAGSAH